jgi:transposase
MNKDYSGKTIFIGIDVHKKTYSVYCVLESQKLKSWTMNASPEALVEQLLHYFPNAKICTAYEAGFSGFVLHRKLEAAGIISIVVNPGSIETASRERVKTDTVDAKKLSEQLSFGRLKCIHIPTETEERVRVISRLRTSLMKDRSRLVCRIKSRLSQFGYWTGDNNEKASISWIKGLQTRTDLPEEVYYEINCWCTQWLETTKTIKAVQRKLEEQTKANERLEALELVYRSIPGVGNLSAKEFSRELGDMSHFNSCKKAYSYTGLTPSEHSSGERRRQGGITHCGRPRIRHLLIEVAWRNVSKDKEMKIKFEELSHRAGKKRAIVAIARTLIGRMRHCAMNGVLYQPRLMTKNEPLLVVN